MERFANLSARFRDILLHSCPWVTSPTYFDASSSERWLDLLELYSGKGRLSSAVAKAWIAIKILGTFSTASIPCPRLRHIASCNHWRHFDRWVNLCTGHRNLIAFHHHEVFDRDPASFYWWYSSLWTRTSGRIASCLLPPHRLVRPKRSIRIGTLRIRSGLWDIRLIVRVSLVRVTLRS